MLARIVLALPIKDTGAPAELTTAFNFGKNYDDSKAFIVRIRENEQIKKATLSCCFLLSSGDKTRTCDLWVMSPTSYQLLHPAVFYINSSV
jgi:hypothetical protein